MKQFNPSYIRVTILVLFFTFLFFLFFHPIDSGDFFHNANIGQYVVTHLALPYKDTLSFTAYGQPFVPYGWGAGVIFYTVLNLFGTYGVSVLFGFFGVLASFFLYRTLLNLGVKKISSLVFVFLAASMMSLRYPTRQEVLGPLFLIALVYLLTRYAKHIWIFPFFFWMWGITYGSSTFVGIALFAWYLIVEKIVPRSGIPLRGTSQKENVRKEDGRNILIFCLSFVAAAFLNGNGLKGFLFIQNIPEMLWHNGEWGSILNLINPSIPGITISIQYTFLILALFTVMTVMLMLLAILKLSFFKEAKLFSQNNETMKQPARNTPALVTGGWNKAFFLSLSSFVFTPFIATRFLDTGPLLGMPAVALMASALNRTFQRAVLIFCIILAFSAVYIRFSNFYTGGGIEEGIFPTKAVEFLNKYHISGNIYSIQEIGAYVSYKLPASKVFVDTRDELYVTVFRELKPIYEGTSSLIPLLDKYHTTILVGGMSEVNMYKDLFYLNDWKLVYLSDGNFVFVKKNIADIKHLPTYDAIDLTRNPAVKSGELTEGQQELTQLAILDPHSIDNQVRLAQAYLAEHKARRARDIIDRQHFTFDGSNRVITQIQTLELKGQIYLAINDCTKAKTVLLAANDLSYGKLIFFPWVRLGTVVDKYLGDYYTRCQKDPQLAQQYYNRYLPQVANPLERMDIEQRLQKLGN